MFRIAVGVALIQFSQSLRKVVSKAAVNVESVACPVLASITNAGFVSEDAMGRVSQNAIIQGLMLTGNTKEMAAFQAKGIAGFAADDKHQNDRTKFAKDPENRRLNFRTMNVPDACTQGHSLELPSGHPCNANVAFQQHGFSTLLRDPRGGSTGEERFNTWFEKEGVLTQCDECGGRVMKLEGLGKLLKYARVSGDHSGEFSLNPDGTLSGSPLSRLHPSITNVTKARTVSQWQAVSAWSSFWAAFYHKENGQAFMKYDDLKSLFVDGHFPQGWTAKPYGFNETFETVAALDGSEAGDEWCALIKSRLQSMTDDERTEDRLFKEMGLAVGGTGAGLDKIQNHFGP